MDRTHEARAAHFFQRGLYAEALQAYTHGIGALPKTCKPELKTNLIFNRSACYLKLKQFQRVVEDCNLILTIDSKHEKALGRKIKAMCSLGRFSEAQSLAHQWIQSDPMNQQAVKELERLNVIVKALKEQEDEDNIIMGSTDKNSPQHNKTRLPSPQSAARTGPIWNTSQPRSASYMGPGLPWQQPPAPGVSAWGGGGGAGDLWGQSNQPITSPGQGTGDNSNNSVWGMAINTTWGDTVVDNNKSLNKDFPALPSEDGGYGKSNNGIVGAKSAIISGTSNETTSLVWSNNPLSGSAQQVASLSTSSKMPAAYHQHLSMQGNPLTDTVFNGKTSNNTESSLFGGTASNVQSGSSLSHNLTGLPPGPSIGLGQDLAALLSNPAPLSDRQKPLSPPWARSSAKQSRFPFANRESSFDGISKPLQQIWDSNGIADKSKNESGMLWNTSPLQTGSRSDIFPNLSTEDTFSALKSLISSAPKPPPSSAFPYSSSSSSADKLLLQHMQRNTGSIQPLHEKGFPSSLHHNKSEIVDRLSKAGQHEETGGKSHQVDEGALDRQHSNEEKASVIGHSFIPPVIQAKMLSSKKPSTEPITSPCNNVAFKVAESILDNSGHGLDTAVTNGVDNGALKGLVSPTSAIILPSALPKDNTKLDGSGNYSVSSADESVISTVSSVGSASHLDSTTESITLKEDENGDSIQSSDRVWKYRPPPRGLTSQEYTKCPRYQTFGMCSFGENCSQAHSDDEVKEWKERFEERKKKLLISKEADKQGESYAKKLMEKLMKTENASSVMTDVVEGVNIHVNAGLEITTQTKKSSHSWLFTVTSKLFLQKVVLIGDDSRKHYHISSITMGPKKPKKNQKIMKVTNHCQAWDNPEFTPGKFGTDKVFRIKLTFKTDIFGTFRQSVVFDFGLEPVVVRYLCVDSCPVTDLDQLNKDLKLSESGRWDINKLNVVEFSPKILTIDDTEKGLLEQYPAPTASKIAAVSQSLLEPVLTKDNYRGRLHNMLSIEEMAQFSSIAKFNVQTNLQIVQCFMLMPSTVSTAKFAQNGQLFARMELTSDVSEDTSHGRLILQNVYTAYIAPCKKTGSDQEGSPDKVYEAVIEEKGKNFIFLRLSETCVSELSLKVEGVLYAQVQFQLNRMPLCEMHLAVEKLPSVDTVFPTSQSLQQCHWVTQMTAEYFDDRLNEKQKEAVSAITAKSEGFVPPVLLLGPYGTGKTFTLAQAAKQILKQEGTRVLICTHSNSAADLYISDYLHSYVEEGHTEAFPLRIYYRHRWVQTVNPVVLQYSLTKVEGVRGRVFVDPCKADVEKRRVLVATFSTCRQLFNLGLPKGFFSHILLDEAAQALECETLMPLALADSNTRVVLAGDHMQLSPEVHSEFAKDRNFHISMLERLYNLYPHKFACKIMLCENYRSHKAILDFTSELFYDSNLVASGNQPKHDKFYPLTFFTAQGEDTQHQNSTAFYNNAEVYEIVERVSEVQRFWPKSWGTLDESSIGVVSPYTDQVVRIRAELRKKKLRNVSVERVLNVQGKQFRVIFLSTVRTRHSCSSDAALEEFMDYGFLSNVKLLNTAITRAQSLVAVVGDPVSLCSIGKCRKLWERFLEICTSNNSMYGMTWAHLRAQLDGVELKKTYILNPLAPEFVPNRLRHTQYAPPEPIAYGRYGFAFAPTSQLSHQQAAMGLPPHLPWQHNPRLMPMMPPVMPPQMYMNPSLQYHQYMTMLQGGIGGMNYGPQLPPQNLHYLGMKDHKMDPRRPAYVVPRQSTQPLQQASAPAQKQQESEGVSSKVDVESHSENDKVVDKKKDGSSIEDVAKVTKTVVSTHQPVTTVAVPPPYARINPMYMPPQYQRFAGLTGAIGPHHNMIPPPAIHPALLHAGGRGFALSPYALGSPAQLQGLLSPGKSVAASQPRPIPQFPHGAAMALRNLHSPSLSPRSNRSSSMSPTRMLGQAGSPSSSVEFLPKAMNVRNIHMVDDRRAAQLPNQPLPTPLSQTYGGAIPKGVPKTPNTMAVTEAQSLMKSPYLQRELYSYIMQKEGQGAAENFVSSFATHQPVQPDRIHPSQQLHQAAEHLNYNPLHQQQSQSLHHSQSLPAFFPSDYPGSMPPPPPPPFFMRPPMKGAAGTRPGGPQQQFMAQDLERQWQEESLREHTQVRDAEVTGITSSYHEEQQLRYMDKYAKPMYNPNFDVVSEQFLLPRRQSPFGDGPQPYSRQKLLGEGRRDSQDRLRNDSGDAANGSRPSSQSSERHTSSATSGLSIEVDPNGTVIEKELGQIHIDSPVAASLSPAGATTGERKAPLYMRRVKDEAMPPPRLSYAGALRSQNQTGSTENTPPTATPQTRGPYTPDDFPLFPGSTEREQDPLELLRNLNIKESPGTQALFQYFS